MWTEEVMPYLKNVDIFRCPSAAQEWEWNANCYPGTQGRPQNNWRVNYGFNEGMFNDVNGINKLPSIKSPAEVVLMADNFNSFLTPWAHTDPEGVNPRIAFANGPGAGMSCGCPAHITDMNQVVQLTRHTEGATLIFADGHAKWYRWDMIKPRILWGIRYGGKLRISCADIGEWCQ
jgi:prepilin-type processing-associated H-X9-DG protein